MQCPAHCRHPVATEQFCWKPNALSAEFILESQKSGLLFSIQYTLKSMDQLLALRATNTASPETRYR